MFSFVVVECLLLGAGLWVAGVGDRGLAGEGCCLVDGWCDLISGVGCNESELYPVVATLVLPKGGRWLSR